MGLKYFTNTLHGYYAASLNFRSAILMHDSSRYVRQYLSQLFTEIFGQTFTFDYGMYQFSGSRVISLVEVEGHVGRNESINMCNTYGHRQPTAQQIILNSPELHSISDSI
jgi:hypothetical protein